MEALKETFRYNSFVRKKYLDALSRLPKEELVLDRGASYPWMLDIFGHVLGAYAHWLMDAYSGDRTKEFEQLMDVETLEDAREDEKLVDTYVMNFVEGLDEEKLDLWRTLRRASGESVYESYCGIWSKKNSNTEKTQRTLLAARY